jgi:hypothetical protein
MLLSGGTVLVTKGIASQDELNDIIGGLLGFIAVVWSYWHHSTANAPAAAVNSGNQTLTAAVTKIVTAKNSGILLCALSLFCGCASAPETAFKAEAATDITVSAAMTAWGDYVAQFHPPASEELAVESAFDKYQALEILAVDATAFYTEETSTNSAGSTAAMTSAQNDAGQALEDLISLIRTFGVKI